MQDDLKKAFENTSEIEKKYLQKWLLMQARKDVMVKQGRTEELVRKEMVSALEVFTQKLVLWREVIREERAPSETQRKRYSFPRGPNSVFFLPSTHQAPMGPC